MGVLTVGLKGFLRSDLLVGGGNLAAPIGQGHERGTARLRTTILAPCFGGCVLGFFTTLPSSCSICSRERLHTGVEGSPHEAQGGGVEAAEAEEE